MKEFKDNSIDLVLIDPPYNIGKDKWDKWRSVEDYVEFMGKVFKEIERVLKPNGSFYFFHNDFLQIVELQNWININSNFIFKSFLIWNKRYNGSPRKYYFDNVIAGNMNRNHRQLSEYCLFYTFQDDTGLNVINNDLELYKPIRDYFKNERLKTNLSYKELNELMGVASNGGGMASNILTSYKKGWTFPTKEKYELLQKTGICQKNYDELRQEYETLRQEYETLRQEYEKERYTFNNQKTHHDILDFEVAKKQGHLTPKPVDLLEYLIKTSSNESDVVLDCFMGSGSTGVACMNANRYFIGIELEEKYFEIAKKRIEESLK
jgi:site-specific DNA-methyltransferase (adenine-specific)